MDESSNNHELKKIILKFRTTVFLYWALSSSFLCFYVIYLQTQKSLPVTEIGVMIALYTLSVICGLYILGYICDKTKSIKKVYLLGVFIIGITSFIFPYNNHKFLIYSSIVVVGFLQQPVGAIGDSWLMKHLGKHNAERTYGKIRAFGSLGWALTAIITAFFMHHIHLNLMFIICSTAAVLLIISASLIPDVNDQPQKSQEPVLKITFSKAFMQLIRNRKFVAIVLILFIYFIGEQTFYNFLGLIIKESGGHLLTIGLTYFLAASFEVPSMFMASNMLKKHLPLKLMMLGVSLNLLRYIIILYFRTPLSITLAYMLEGFSFGLVFTAYRSYVYTVAPKELQTMAFTIGDAVVISFSLIVGASFGGFIIDHFGIIFLTTCCMACCISALLMLGFKSISDKKVQNIKYD